MTEERQGGVASKPQRYGEDVAAFVVIQYLAAPFSGNLDRSTFKVVK